MKNKVSLSVQLLLSMACIWLLGWASVSQDLNTAMLSVVALFLAMVVFAFRNTGKRFALLLFLLAFFTFLLGKSCFAVLIGEPWWGDFDAHEAWNTVYCLLLTLSAMLVGAKCYEMVRFQRKNSIELFKQSEMQLWKVESIRFVSKWIFWLTVWATAYAVFHKVIFVQRHGYLAYYTSYQAPSGLILKIQIVNECAFLFFLATLPRLKEALLPIGTWVVLQGATILAGGRASLVTTAFLFLWYFRYRNEDTAANSRPWFTKWMKIAIVVFAPIAIAMLGYWNYARTGSVDGFNLLNSFYVFFDDQGGSLDLISYAKEYQGQFPQSYYTFGPLIRFCKGNFIGQLFADYVIPAQNTVEMATTGYNFGQTITWLVMPHNYVTGIGLGGCYIAELWLDFGFAGVIVYNILLGMFFGYMGENRRYSVVGLYLTLMVFSNIMLLPRDCALVWFMGVFNISVILTTVAILFLAKLYRHICNPLKAL